MPDLTPQSVTNRPSQARLHAMAAHVHVGHRTRSERVWIGLAILAAVAAWALACRGPQPLMSVDFDRSIGARAGTDSPASATPAERPRESRHTQLAPASSSTRAGASFDLSVYARRYSGRRTASGMRYDPTLPTCASNRHGLGSIVKVSHGGRVAYLMVTDRLAPDLSHRIDLSSWAWNRLSGGAKPGVLKGARVMEVAR